LLLLKAFKNRVVFRLWLGQLGSSIGDEIYRMAFIWLSVGFIGADTGYLAALQLFAVLLFGIFGGKWADRSNPYRTMIGVDGLRALITLIPVVFFYLRHGSFIALIVSTVFLSGLGAFFEPALQSVLPRSTKDLPTLRAANGLMSTTIRFARVFAPIIVGTLSAFIATIHFFTLNSLSYLISTLSIFSVRKEISFVPPVIHAENEHVLANFFQSLKLLSTKPSVQKTLFAKTLTGGAWSLVYGLGLALLVHEMDQTNVKAFGMVMGAYGFGNIIGAMAIANFERKNPRLMVFQGLTWLGIGFIGIALTHSFALMLVVTAITAVGGPMNDVPFTDLIQMEFDAHELTKIVRIRMMSETFFALVFMAVSPLLFHFFAIRTVIIGAGVFTLVFGLRGLRST